MSEQVIKLSDNAADRIKQIMSKAEKSAIDCKGGSKIWRVCRNVLCDGICKEIKPNEEVIEDKGVKVFIDPKLSYIF